MNKKTLAAVIAVIIATSIGTSIGYQTFYELSNVDASIRDSNVHIDNSNVTLGENVTITNPPNGGKQDTTPGVKIPPVEPPEELPYDYVIYEWHLKAEYINNVQWLNSTFRYHSSSNSYNTSQTWTENYIRFLSERKYFRVNVQTAPAYDVFVSAEFNAETGWTKAVYQYQSEKHATETWSHYAVEVWLMHRNVTANGYTKTLT